MEETNGLSPNTAPETDPATAPDTAAPTPANGIAPATAPAETPSTPAPCDPATADASAPPAACETPSPSGNAAPVNAAPRSLFYPLKAAKAAFGRAALAVCLMCAATQVFTLIASVLLGIFAPQLVAAPWFTVVYSVAVVYLVGAPVFLLTLRGTKRLPPPKSTMTAGQFAVSALMAIGIAYIFNYVGTLVLRVIDGALGIGGSSVVADAVLDCPLWILILCTVVIAPIGEELLFRRALCDRTAAFGEWQAMLFSGLLFALYHGSSEQFFYTLPFGIFLAFLYIRTGRVAYTIGLHAIFNFIGAVPGVLLTRYGGVGAIDEALLSGEPITVDFILEHLGALLLYGGYLLAIFALAITGFVLLCKNRKKMRAATLPSPMPRGARFKILCGSAGFWVLVALWAASVALNAYLPIIMEAMKG